MKTIWSQTIPLPWVLHASVERIVAFYARRTRERHLRKVTADIDSLPAYLQDDIGWQSRRPPSMRRNSHANASDIMMR